MNADLANKLLIAARTGIFVVTNLTMMIILMNRMLNRKRPMTFLLTWCAINTVVVKILFNIILIDYFAKSDTLNIIYLIIICVTSLFYAVPIVYTYEGTISKKLLVQFVSELIAVTIGSLAMMVINLIVKRNIVDLHAPITGWDLLFPIVSCIFFLCIYRLFGWLFNIIKKLKLGYFSIGFYIIEIIWVGSAINSFVTSLESSADNYFKALITLGSISSILIFIDTYQKQTLQDHMYLVSQQKLLNTHYEAIGIQVAKIRLAQQQISQEMEAIMQMDLGTEKGDAQLEAYLNGLKEHTSVAKAGVYCDDWIVDSILYHNELICRQSDIEISYDFSKYHRGNISDEDVSKILTYMLDTAVKQVNEVDAAKKIVLEAMAVKGQLIFRLECNRIRKYNIKPITDYVKVYDGFVRKRVLGEKGNELTQVEISLKVN